MAIYEVKTKVYDKQTNQFVGNSTATIDADDKDEAKFQFYHGIILAFAPESHRVIPDMRTLKLKISQNI